MTSLTPGLYLVATPIGNARDITLRALDVLASADVLAAEDTRVLRRLLDIHGIPVGGRPLVPHHDHSGPKDAERLLDHVAVGKAVALCSDAGTPMVADPGFELVRAARARDLAVTALPGASSVLTALCLAGLPTDRFTFLGFVPKSGTARAAMLAEMAAASATVVVFETARRVQELVRDLCETCGEDRPAAICRELTKRFEEVRSGPLGTLRDTLGTMTEKGEIVLVLDRAPPRSASAADLTEALTAALSTTTLRDAVDRVAADLDLPRRTVYQRALALGKAGRDD